MLLDCNRGSKTISTGCQQWSGQQCSHKLMLQQQQLGVF